MSVALRETDLSEEALVILQRKIDDDANIIYTSRTLDSEFRPGMTNRDALMSGKYHQPKYTEIEAHKVLMNTNIISEGPPLVELEMIQNGKDMLARVEAGEAMLLITGLCAERILKDPVEIEAHARGSVELLDEMARMVQDKTGLKVMKMMRGPLQLFKPRSSAYEEDNVTISHYGEGVNGIDPNDRMPAASRLLEAHEYASKILHAMKKVEKEKGIKNPTFTIHEDLHLVGARAYDRTHKNTKYRGSATGVWVGDRTSGLDGPHVAEMEGIENIVGIKLSSKTKPEILREYSRRINPNNEKGKMIGICRFGADRIAEDITALLEMIKKEGINITLVADVSHGPGNNIKKEPKSGKKTRLVPLMKEEAKIFVEKCIEYGVHPGGFMIESSHQDVTECLDENVTDLTLNYQSTCDPCANPDQTYDVLSSGASAYARLKPRIFNTGWDID